jgi:hypothetical protein
VAEVADMPARVENRTKKISDGAGGLVDQQVRFPVWMDPVSNGGTPMCEAFNLVSNLIDQWLTEHRHSFPPTILHLTDGESTDGDPSSVASALMGKGTADGNVLLFNCHVSPKHAVKIEYPSHDESLPDDFARMLFKISTPLPPAFQNAAANIGLKTEPTSRGFVFNGDPVSVAQFFEIGTRPANLR